MIGRMVRGEGKGCTLIDFTITKQLTKDINKYPNDKGQPHVHVAKRMIEKGNKGMSLTHHYIPYVIIKNDKVSINLVCWSHIFQGRTWRKSYSSR